MRPLAGLVVLALVVVPALAALGEMASYQDDFSEGTYSENDGTVDFTGPWMEFGDSGGYVSGKVHVGSENCSNNDCLHIEGEGSVGAAFGVVRSADLSFFTSAQLSYDIDIEAVATDQAELRIQVSTGGSWVTLKSYDLSKSVAAPKSFALNSYRHEDFALRFVVVGSQFTGAVAIDRLDVSGAGTPPPTTSTSTTSTSTTTTTVRTTTTSSVPTTTSTAPTTTSSTPTTTSTAPTTTSTAPTTTSSAPTTTATAPAASSTTSTAPTTSTTESSTTTTTLAATAGGDDTTPSSPVFEPGIHDMGQGQGVMVDYHEVNGDVSGLGDVEVLSAEVTADFSLAVEAFQSTKIWTAALGLMIAAALVSGMDHRRRAKGDFSSSAGEPLVEG